MNFQVKKIDAEHARELADDERFFLRHPQRTNRVRRPFRREYKLWREKVCPQGVEPSRTQFVLVRDFGRGVRDHQFFDVPAGQQPPDDEAWATRLYRGLAPPEISLLMAAASGST